MKAIEICTDFARFLADAGNWPEGEVADEAKALAHVVGVSAPSPAPSAGQTDKSSSAQEKAA